ncbi:MAG: molybdate ABC transporter substrate-binding protein [Dehalococcoidia bacterium]|nr:MAG: molybdate ABC transporter substrate-binding protein [Dehalococcoidia bacterium]
MPHHPGRYAGIAATMIAALAGVMLAACGGGGNSSNPNETGTAAGTPGISGSITVYAASSLTTAFYKEAASFQQAHPDWRVNFNFAGSPTLVTQLDQGAPGDVLATADEKNMKSASDKQLVTGDVKIFAKNRLVIAVPKSNPGNVNTPADLAKRGLRIVLAQEGVPVGDYSRESLSKMESDPAYGAGFRDNVLKNVVSDESNVKGVVSKVQLGEADAGIVYKTDVTAGVGIDVTTIDIPDAFNVIASYPIAVTAHSRNPGLAAEFVKFVLSKEGQQILAESGFMEAGS